MLEFAYNIRRLISTTLSRTQRDILQCLKGYIFSRGREETNLVHMNSMEFYSHTLREERKPYVSKLIIFSTKSSNQHLETVSFQLFSLKQR